MPMGQYNFAVCTRLEMDFSLVCLDFVEVSATLTIDGLHRLSFILRFPVENFPLYQTVVNPDGQILCYLFRLSKISCCTTNSYLTYPI